MSCAVLISFLYGLQINCPLDNKIMTKELVIRESENTKAEILSV